MLIAASWSWLIWVGVFAIIWIYVYRTLSGTIQVTNKMKDGRGRLPVVLDEKNPQYPLETTALSEGEYAGHPYEARFHSGEGVRPPFLVVSWFAPSAYCFTVIRNRPSECPKSFLARFMIKRVLTGDQSFDDDFRVYAHGSTAPLEPCLQSPELRAAVRRLFDLGFTCLRSDGKGFDAAWPRYAGPQPVEPGLVETALSNLNMLASQAPAPTAGAGSKAINWNFAATVAMILATLGLLLLIHILRARGQAVVPDYHGTRVILLSGLSLGVLAAAWVIWRFRRTRPVFLLVFFSLFAAMFSLVSVGATYMCLNAQLDRGPESRYLQPIIAYGYKHDPTPSYYVDVQHWLAGQASQRVLISKQEYEQIAGLVEESDEAGVYLEVTIRPGYFGSPWISSYELVEESPDDEPEPLPAPSGRRT